MRIRDLDYDPETGARPIADAARWLASALGSPAVAWDPQQRAAAEQCLAEVAAVLDRTISTPHCEVHPLGTASVMAALYSENKRLRDYARRTAGSPALIGGARL